MGDDPKPPADKPTPFQSTCDHAESLWGRCTACGRTWEQQARDRLVPGSAAHTFANYGVPHPERAEDGQPDADDELLDRMRRMFEATLWAYTDLEPGARKAVAEYLAGDMVGDGVDPGLLDEYRAAEARSHGEVLATGELIDAVHVGDDVCLHVRLPAPELGHLVDLGAEVLVVLAPTAYDEVVRISEALGMYGDER